MVDILERPGVEVEQQFTASPPTFITPTLQACVIGPLNQIVEAVGDDGTLSSDAQVIMAAALPCSAVVPAAGYVGLAGLTLELTLSGKPYVITFRASPVNLTPDQARQDVVSAAIPGFTARVEATSDTESRLVLESSAVGDAAGFTITGGTALTVLGLTAPLAVVGASGYRNAFITRIPRSAYPDPRDILDDLEIDYDSVRVFLDDGTGNPTEVTEVVHLRGATAAVSVVDDGDGDTTSPVVRVAGEDFTAAATAAVATGTAAVTDFAGLAGLTLKMSVDREWWQTVTFPAGMTTLVEVLAEINAVWPGLAADAGGGELELTSGLIGDESALRVDAGSTALALLFLNTGGGPFETVTLVKGTAFPAQVGDTLYADGVAIGTVLEVAPGSVVTDLRISTEVALTYTATTYRMLSNAADGAATATTPTAGIQVNPSNGEITLAPGYFRNNDGSLNDVSGFPMYVGYNALRTDQSPANADFRSLIVGDLDTLEGSYGPVDTQNPLSLGLYAAMLNAPGISVIGIGVDETNDAAPEGTTEAYARAFEHAEALDVYSLAPMTHDAGVGQVGMVHVDFMSEPASKGERILIANPARPTRQSDTLVASGATGNVATTSPNNIVTGIAALPAYLSALGYPGPTFTEDDGVFVEMEGDTNRYLVASIAGDVLVINNGPLTDDSGFYYDANGSSVFSAAVVDRPFSVKIKGGALTSREEEAIAYSDAGRAYQNRRVIATAPDKAGMSIDGLETLVEGYYLSAALAGVFSRISPAAPLTEQPIAGFTRVEGTTNYFSENQLNILAGGGLWVFYNDASTVKTRHQITTDLTSVKTRETSITRAVDYAAKFYRRSLRNFIGGFNIDTTLLESLNISMAALSQYLVEQKVLKSAEGGTVQQRIVEGEELDETEATVVIETYKPHTRMRLTLLV